jgi:hypothetical protein
MEVFAFVSFAPKNNNNFRSHFGSSHFGSSHFGSSFGPVPLEVKIKED